MENINNIWKSLSGKSREMGQHPVGGSGEEVFFSLYTFKCYISKNCKQYVTSRLYHSYHWFHYIYVSIFT